MHQVEPDPKLIPPSTVVRVELARSARENRRLRSLLRLSLQAEEDRRFIETQTGYLPRREATCGA